MDSEQTNNETHSTLAIANQSSEFDSPREESPTGESDTSTHPFISPWKDQCPSAKYLKRALNDATNKRARYKEAVRALLQEIEQLKAEHEQSIARLTELVEITGANYKALEDRFRELYVGLQLLKSRESDAADSQPAGVDPGNPELPLARSRVPR